MRTRYAEPLIYGIFAVYAFVTVLIAMRYSMRVWGTFACVAYGLAAVTWFTRGARDIGRAGMVVGSTVVPLAVLVVTGRSLSEIPVIKNSAAHLLAHGTPYLSPAELAWQPYTAYNPYLPGMSLFGMPATLAGHGVWTDPRWLFAGMFAVVMPLALALMGRSWAVVPLGVLIASPVVAIPLTGGGDDLPVIALCCLGLALAARERPSRAGLVIGIAAILKATAWPALAVGLALAAARGGRRAAGRYAAASAAPLALGIGLPALVDPAAFVENAVRFPVGMTPAVTPAASTAPGTLLAGTGPDGHVLALVLLVVAALGVAASLVFHPPATGPAAARRLAAGLVLATALMPATRWGYLIYPAVLLTWAWLCEREQAAAAPAVPRDFGASSGFITSAQGRRGEP